VLIVAGDLLSAWGLEEEEEGDIACSACAAAVIVYSLVNRLDYDWVTRHPKVIIRSPHTNPFILVLGMGIRKLPRKLCQ
jgi:hypothetical protein